MAICDYGCGKEANFKFKNGKKCCSAQTVQCAGLRKKNSNSIRKLRQEKGNSYWKNGHPKGSKGGTSLKGKTYEEIHGEEEAIKQKQKRSDASKNLPHSWDLMTEEEQEKHREDARRRILERYEAGWMPKAGRCKKYIHESPIAGKVSLDGTWELAVAKWLDEKGYIWKRNTKRFPYINLKGKLSHYTPDFWVNKFESYVEVKGYETDLDRCKWSQFNEPLMVWKKKEIKEIMEDGQDGNAADC